MPLAYESGVVARFLKLLGKGGRAFGEEGAVVQNAMGMGELPAEDRGPAWRTKGGGHETVLENHASFRQGIKMGRLVVIIYEAHGVKAHVINEDEDQVAQLGRCGLCACGAFREQG
ncbi:MAG: hypothetical protein L3K26_06490 [Candidatus Hydrogenedentes bacterium]|nr:hypothetical protein [Candidatus Hydrogenedentota bacterium]